MKIYISADIEGITGIVNWDEATRCKPDYTPFQAEMINEVRAACEGANNRGAKEIWVKDAHWTARNLSFDGLPNNTRLIRAFNGHPYAMMQELDKTFDAVLMIGYHSYASYTAAMMNVPVVFVSGDEGLCGHVKSINKNIITVSVGKGVGSSVISIHPEVVFCNIKSGVEEALSKDFKKCKLNLPQNFLIELSYIDHAKAYKASFYPGMDKVSATTLVFKTNDYFEVLRMLAFVV